MIPHVSCSVVFYPGEFTENGHGPQCVTNHLVSSYKSASDLPQGEGVSSYSRFRLLHEAITSKKKFSLDELKSINADVAVLPNASAHPIYAPGRTLWHALYDTEKRSLMVKFYLGEEPDPSDKKKVRLKYSDYLQFQLKVK